MDQIKYQGYARDRGFNPIQMSTASVDAIAQQGNAMSRQMRENQSAERSSRDAYQSQVNQNNQLEDQNRDRNFQFSQDSRQSRFDAKAQNYQMSVRNAEAQGQQTAKMFEQLSAFSGTISKIVLDQKKKQDEAAELEGANIAFESGIPFEDFQVLKAGEAQINAADTQLNSVVNKLKASGYSDEYISRLRNLSGRQLYGASKQWAIQGGENYGAFRAENADTPFLVNGREISLAEAAKGSPEDYAAVNAAVRTEYLKKYQGLNRAFANQYLYEGMRKQEARERLNFSEVRAKELELDRVNQESNDLFTEIKDPANGVGGGILSWINRKAGGDPKELGEKRREALGYLTTLAKSGQFNSSQLQELDDYLFIPNGESKEVRFGERFGPDLVELRNTVRTFNNQQRQDIAIQEGEEQKAFEEKINQYIAANGPLTQAEARELGANWQERGWGSTPAWIKSMETAEELAAEQGKQILEQLKADGMLTTKELNSGRYSATLRNQYEEDAKKQESIDSKTRDGYFNTLDADLMSSLGTIDKGSARQNGDFFLAQDRARQTLTQNATALISQGVAPDQAWKQATLDLRKDIQEGVTGKGQFAVRMQADGKSQDLKNPGFALAGSGTNATAQKQRAVKVQAEITANKALIFSKNYLTPAELEQLEGFRSGNGTIPPIIRAMTSRIKNASPFDIIDAQMKANKREPLQRPNSARLYDEVNPQFRQLLTWRPSMDRTLRALEGNAGGTGGAAGNPYAPILDLIASKESSNDTKFNGYDSMNKGGTNNGHTAIGSGTGSANFGRPLTQMTVGEVLANGRAGNIHAAGRYQFINPTLQGLVDRGKARTGELFNEATQDKLAVALLREQTGAFWSGKASAGSYVPGLGRTWIGLQYLPAGKLAGALEQAKANLNNPNIDVSRLRTQVAYKVGSIGPTSTGPHLDVKDTSGAFFARKDLDNYVGFKIGTKVVPLSVGVTIKNGEFGAPRSYGSHNGWDYAMPSGTPVVLRNGAWVVSKRPSEHGDVLTIGLPDGRRFTFLHGKAV
jgi:muramidase (phage lysozyme)